METIVLRRQLHNYLEIADDKKIEVIYTIMKTEISESLPPYSAELKDELQQRASNYKNGKAKTVSAEESKERIQAILNRMQK